MKKSLISIPLTLSLLLTPASAITGDISGKVYKTDIVTYFFGHEINSYNIGGRTCVVAEDLSYFGGFSADWDPHDRRLTITDSYAKRHGEAADAAYDQPAFPEGYHDRKAPENIYETDIEAILNSDEASITLESFNIGGQTCVIVEDLLKLGYNVVWDAEKRELRVDHDHSEKTLSTDIGTGYSDGYPEHSPSYYASAGKCLLSVGEITEEVNSIDFTPSTTTIGPMMIKLTDLCRLTGINYSFGNDILTLDTSGAVKFNVENQIGTESRKLAISELDELYLDRLIIDGEESEFSFEWSTMMGSSHHVRKVGAIVFEGEVYVPAGFMQKLLAKGE